MAQVASALAPERRELGVGVVRRRHHLSVSHVGLERCSLRIQLLDGCHSAATHRHSVAILTEQNMLPACHLCVQNSQCSGRQVVAQS